MRSISVLPMPCRLVPPLPDGLADFRGNGFGLCLLEVEVLRDLHRKCNRRRVVLLIDCGRENAGLDINWHGIQIVCGRQPPALLPCVEKTVIAEVVVGVRDQDILATLSLAEIRAARPETVAESAIVHGGFPELHADPEIDHVAFYNSYLATYLERDLRSLANVGSLRDFERFLRACALRSANLLNKVDLARDVGISPTTANHWLSA
jgi:hypothetical protein